MKKAGVIGKPIGHSLSPAIFTFLSPLNFEYNAYEVAPSELSEFMLKFRGDPKMVGLNVTLPHKNSILAYLDEQSHEVQTTGAANVIYKSDTNKLIGYNTDIYGIQTTLQCHFATPEFLQGKRAWVIGAGGGARSVLYALGKFRLKQVDLIHRNSESALLLLEKMRLAFPSTQWRFVSSLDSLDSKNDRIPLHFEPGDPFTLCINTTPLGMHRASHGKSALTEPTELSTPMFEIAFSSSLGNTAPGIVKAALAFDLIYRPENTVFLRAAQKHGLVPIGGLEMLVDQALAAWQLWNHPISDIQTQNEETKSRKSTQRESLLKFLRNRPIFLTGLMGAGKSTVGEVLARRLQRDYLDLDQIIESTMNKTVGQLFEEKGEANFRIIEFEAFQKVLLLPNSVVALGGGTLIHPKVRSLIQKVGTLVYLRATPETLAKRVRNHHVIRPLLANLNDMEQEDKIKNLLKERESFYLQAPIQMDTDKLTPEEIAVQISKTSEILGESLK